MEIYILTSLLFALVDHLPAANNPAYLDLLKLCAGSVLWIGGLVGFMYWRQFKLKAAVNE
jgi:hypothetical protein